MVLKTSILLKTWKGPVHKGRQFIDKLRILVKGGAGGQGLQKYGGIGGQGGKIYVVAEEGTSLRKLKKSFPKQRFTAGTGGNSRQWRLLGEEGKDIEIPVPPGVAVRTEHGRILGDLDKPGSRLLVADGGSGGSPDTGYMGLRTNPQMVVLDLKLIADIGLVGFPNAGKSTLLSALSRANPKIANYPFTTIRPQIGVMKYEDGRQISMADLPGLIEGAYRNVGMGHTFLKHVERTKLLLYVIDLHGFQLNQKHNSRSALETVVLLNKELELYKPELVTKPSVLVINKIDIPGSETKVKELIHNIRNIKDSTAEIPKEYIPDKFVDFDEIIPISAKWLESIDEVQEKLRVVLDFHAEKKLQEEQDNDERIGVKRPLQISSSSTLV